ncbi:MAG: hypothetical protein EON59_07275 [Alphaproteobacteria bacterium]|nr:MAG: hypothetical protein EON59_07275 [Alphaproteobacteria bacterium]
MAIEQVGEFAVLGYAKSYTTRADGSDTQDFAEFFEGTRFRFLASGIHELLIPTSEWSPLGNATRNVASLFSTVSVAEPSGQKGFATLMLIPQIKALALSHTGFATWYANQGTALANGRTLQLSGGFSYGVVTAPGGLPGTGTKTFKGFGDLEGYGVSSPLEVTVDFATGRLTGKITPTFLEFGGSERPVGPYSFAGSVAAGALSAAVDVALPNGKTGRIDIVFTGPAAEEMMVRFRGTIPCAHISEAGCSVVMPGAAIWS